MDTAKHSALMMRLAVEKLSRETIKRATNGVECPVAARVLARIYSSEGK